MENNMAHLDGDRTMQPLRPGSKDVLCIVLSFNGCDDTLECLKSITSQRVPGFDLLVIDNASEKGVVDRLRDAYPDVELVALNENMGWAGGNNVGIKTGLKRGYTWICLLNNDTVFPKGEVSKWHDAIMHTPPCLLHPTIYYWDEPETLQLNAMGDLHGGKNEIKETWHGKAVMGRAYGACLAVHRQVFDTVGVFDERLFLQLEETDFYQRAAGKDFKAVCDGSVKIFHKESRAFGGTQAPIKSYYTIRNSLLLVEKKNFAAMSRVRGYKELYWTISGIAARATNSEDINMSGLLQWSMSSYPGAVALRLAISDYLFRNFGKLAVKKALRIKAAETIVANRKPAQA